MLVHPQEGVISEQRMQMVAIGGFFEIYPQAKTLILVGETFPAKFGPILSIDGCQREYFCGNKGETLKQTKVTTEEKWFWMKIDLGVSSHSSNNKKLIPGCRLILPETEFNINLRTFIIPFFFAQNSLLSF